jgi:hypothetical protein
MNYNDSIVRHGHFFPVSHDLAMGGHTSIMIGLTSQPRKDKLTAEASIGFIVFIINHVSSQEENAGFRRILDGRQIHSIRTGERRACERG